MKEYEKIISNEFNIAVNKFPKSNSDSTLKRISENVSNLAKGTDYINIRFRDIANEFINDHNIENADTIRALNLEYTNKFISHLKP